MNSPRNVKLFEQAISGLFEYYPCFGDNTLIQECESVINVPDTGNDQLDYENVRDQVEKFAREYERLHPPNE